VSSQLRGASSLEECKEISSSNIMSTISISNDGESMLGPKMEAFESNMKPQANDLKIRNTMSNSALNFMVHANEHLILEEEKVGGNQSASFEVAGN